MLPPKECINGELKWRKWRWDLDPSNLILAVDVLSKGLIHCTTTPVPGYSHVNSGPPSILIYFRYLWFFLLLFPHPRKKHCFSFLTPASTLRPRLECANLSLKIGLLWSYQGVYPELRKEIRKSPVGHQHATAHPIHRQGQSSHAHGDTSPAHTASL